MPSYESKNGPPARSILKTSARHSNYCVNRDLLAYRDRFDPVDVYKLRTGAGIENPASSLIEDHIRSERVTFKSNPERGGLCKYFMPSTGDFCPFCRRELSQATALLDWEKIKARKRVLERDIPKPSCVNKWKSRVSSNPGEDCSYVRNRYFGKCQNTRCFEPYGYPGCCCYEDIRIPLKKLPVMPRKPTCWHQM